MHILEQIERLLGVVDIGFSYSREMEDGFFAKLSMEFEDFMSKIDEENSLAQEIKKGLFNSIKYKTSTLFSLRKFLSSLKFYCINTRERKDLKDDIRHRRSRVIARKLKQIRLNLITTINDIKELKSQIQNDSSRMPKQLQADLNWIVTFFDRKYVKIIQSIEILTDSVIYYRHKHGLLKKISLKQKVHDSRSLSI